MTKVKIEGLRELEESLKQLTKATGRATMRRALIKAAQPIVDHARRLAPVDTGHLKTNIIASARIRNTVGHAEYSQTLRSGGSKAEAVTALRSARRAANGGNTFAEIGVGPAVPTPYAHLVEFGTVKMPAQPFLRPAWDAEKDGALHTIADNLRIEIDKSATRARNKAARLAAKG